MRAHANTLYITTQGAYVTRDHQTLRVKVEGKVRLTVPLHHLEGVVCFGRVSVSPAVFATCGEHRLGFSFLSEQGRFFARVVPPIHGNVLLRRRQYRLADDSGARLRLARPMIAAKIQNSRNTLLRAARDGAAEEDAAALRKAAAHLAAVLAELSRAADLNAARGIEGETARTYFGVFSYMVRREREVFAMTSRSRRPPRDPINALLSFVYALVRHDCHSALESVGLDPAVGYLHVDRPGRPSLALDLMEEFRTLVADRLVLALVNRRQVQASDFVIDAAGGVQIDDKARRALLAAYQERKREEVTHPLLGDVVPVGLLPHLQARLLARTLRGDLDDYPALVLK